MTLSRETLSEILATSRKFSRALGGSAQEPRPRTLTIAHAPLSLDTPRTFQEVLRNRRMPEELKTLTQKAVERLRNDYTRIYDEASSSSFGEKAVTHLATILQARFNNSLLRMQQHLSKAMEEVGLAMGAAARVRVTKRYPKKEHGPFDELSIQVMMAFFNWNPFPTSADRKLLADKLHLAPRQVEVWFQNRRRESKKSGIAKNKSDYQHLSNTEPPSWIWEGVASIFGLEERYGTRSRKTGDATASTHAVPESSKVGDLPINSLTCSKGRSSWDKAWGSLGGWCGWGMARRAFLPPSQTSLERSTGVISPSEARKYGMRPVISSPSLGRPTYRYDFGCPCPSDLPGRDAWTQLRQDGKLRLVTDGFVTTAGVIPPKRKNSTCKSLVARFELPWGDLGDRTKDRRTLATYQIGPATAGTYHDVRWYNHIRRYTMGSATRKASRSRKTQTEPKVMGHAIVGELKRQLSEIKKRLTPARHEPPKKEDDEYVQLDEQGAPLVVPGFTAKTQRSTSLRSVRSVSSISSIPSLTHSGSSDDEGDTYPDTATTQTSTLDMRNWSASIPPAYEQDLLVQPASTLHKTAVDFGFHGIKSPEISCEPQLAMAYNPLETNFDFGDLLNTSTFATSTDYNLDTMGIF